LLLKKLFVLFVGENSDGKRIVHPTAVYFEGDVSVFFILFFFVLVVFVWGRGANKI
jgi:hypothetical protein